MLWIAALLILVPQDSPPSTPVAPGTIHGVLLDVLDRPVDAAQVLLCNSASGIPLATKTRMAVTHASKDGRANLTDWWSVPTDAAGVFHFEGVPPGEYRLVAQSYPDLERFGLPPGGALDKHGLTTRLRGLAEGVQVSAGASTAVELEPVGDSTFVYNRGSSNDDWYLFLSRGAPTTDPVLGPLGWKGPFLEQAIGWVRMRGGQALVRGLPAGRLHYVIFANDSRPCFGAGSFQAREGEIVCHDTNLVGGWSDAIHDPPARLLALTNELDGIMAISGSGAVEVLLAAGRERLWQATERSPGFVALFDTARVLGPLDRVLRLPSGLKATVADVMAAAAYVKLRR
jgi:hypothetical protein